MAILYGTQSNGESLPVLVDQFGNLMAKGIDGAAGEKGEQGEKGEKGDPGPNELLPYGPELSYLAIQNGVPTWVFGGGGGGDGPGPDHDLVIFDNREASVSTCKNYGSWSAQQVLVDPPSSWDEYARTLPTWDTPTAQRTGIGGDNLKSGETRFPFSLTLKGGFDKILQITVAYRQKQSNNGGKYNSRTLEVLPDSDKLTVIDNGFKIKEFIGGDYQDVHTCAYLPQRADIGLVNFAVTCTVPELNGETSVTHAFVQRWEYVDASKYLLNRLLKAKDKLITATDIDFSRLIQD